jgi:hypothetical protein
MRSRNLKPGFFKNEKLAELPFEARLLFAGLWCMADRNGRLEDRPKRIKAEIFPYDSVSIEKLLNVITLHDFTLHYEGNGKNYIQIINFEKHQNPHPHEAKSIIPPCNDIKRNVMLIPSSLIPSSLIPDKVVAQAPPRSKFSKPTPLEVTAYASSIGFKLDGERFWNHYESKGWKIGKTPMVNWKSAVVTWKKDAPLSALIQPASTKARPQEVEISEEDRQAGLEAMATIKSTLKAKEISK